MVTLKDTQTGKWIGQVLRGIGQTQANVPSLAMKPGQYEQVPKDLFWCNMTDSYSTQ